MNGATIVWAAIVFYGAWIWITKKNGQSRIIQWGGGFLATSVIFGYLATAFSNYDHQQPAAAVDSTKSNIQPSFRDRYNAIAKIMAPTLETHECTETNSPGRNRDILIECQLISTGAQLTISGLNNRFTGAILDFDVKKFDKPGVLMDAGKILLRLARAKDFESEEPLEMTQLVLEAQESPGKGACVDTPEQHTRFCLTTDDKKIYHLTVADPEMWKESRPLQQEPSEDEKHEAAIALIRSYSPQQAIDFTKPEMEDIQGEGVSKGTAMLAFWATSGLKWNELMSLPSSKHGLIMKDSSPQLGKRLCAKGLVIEIARDKSVEQPLFNGGMLDGAGRIYRFVAVGSTGDIVANTQAGFCGIVTGQQHYPNSIGGVAHAVTLVGLFDLPENKPTKVKNKGTK